MTDAEIVKALELCGKQEACCYCSLDDFGGIDKCVPHLLLNALDLINRQKAEIDILIRKKETLQDEIAEKQAKIERFEERENTIAKMYYKMGVKDVAKRVKEEINFPLKVWKVFDNILKELGGENDERIHRGSRHRMG